MFTKEQSLRQSKLASRIESLVANATVTPEGSPRHHVVISLKGENADVAYIRMSMLLYAFRGSALNYFAAIQGDARPIYQYVWFETADNDIVLAVSGERATIDFLLSYLESHAGVYHANHTIVHKSRGVAAFKAALHEQFSRYCPAKTFINGTIAKETLNN